MLQKLLQKIVHKTAEATGEMIGDTIADKTVKKNRLPAENSKNGERIVVPPKKTRKIKQITTSIIKWNTIEYLNY